MVKWVGGAALLALVLAAAAAATLLYCSLWEDADDKRTEVDEQTEWRPRRLEKRAARIASRRASKDARGAVVRKQRSHKIARRRLEMSGEQRREETERVKMRRVEQYQKLDGAMLHGVRVVVDLSFLQSQTPRERQSVFKQLGCFYGYLKQCPLDAFISLRVASCGTAVAEALCRQHGLLSWKIWRHDESVERVYCADDLVMLSPDAEDVLEDLDASRVYVVGGIADRTVRKGETESKAASHRFRTARLPVREHLSSARTHVLNIDAVLVALNEFANHRDWPRAFARAVPKRITTGRRAKKAQAQ